MATPTVSNSYSNQNLSTVTSNMTSTPIDNSALYYNAAQTSVTINSGISVYGGGGSGGTMKTNPNAMSRVGVPGNNGQHGLVNNTTITTLTNYGALVGGGGGGGQGSNYGGGGYTVGWYGGNGAAGGGGGGGGAGGPAGGGWGTGSLSNNGNPGTISSGGKGGGDGQTDAGGAGGYGLTVASNATVNCSNGAGGGGSGGMAGGKAGTQYAVSGNSIVQNSSLATITSNAGSYYYAVGGTNVYGGGGGSGGYGIVNIGTITTLVNSQAGLYLYNFKVNGITNYNCSVTSSGTCGQLYYYGAANNLNFNLDATNIANYKKQTYNSVITFQGNVLTFSKTTGSLTSNGTTVTWTLSPWTLTTNGSSSYNLVINSITSGSSTKTTTSSKVSTKGSTGTGPTPSGGTGSGPAPVPTPTPTPPPPKPYILSLSNSMTIWSGTNPSNVTQFIWNPTGGITQSNSNSGIADLQPNPTYQSSAGKTTNTWISSGFTLAKGDFIGNSDGSLYLIMNTDGNLNLCTTSYSYYSGVEIPGGRYAGSTGQNAIYQFNEVGNSALINNIYYIDGDTNAYKYPSDYMSQGTNYTQFSNIDACGNDLGPTNNSSETQCEQICDANSNCYGFVLDKNNTCRPKNQNMWPYNNNQIPSQGTNTYLKMNKLIQTPLGVSYNTTNTNSYVAKSYPQASGGIQNAYGLAIYIMSELDKLRILEQNINSMAKEISSNNINIDNNQINILNQANKDKEAIELFIEDYKKIEEGIKKVDNQEYLLVDTDIKLLQENYNYYLWTILAIGIVIVGIHVIKKKPFF